jgi:hypothetical protein
MKPYRPSGKIPLAGYFVMSLAAIVGGSVIGGITHLISLAFYLVIFFPILMGFAGFSLMAIAITSGKVRNPLVASAFGLLTGFSIYGAMNYANYAQFQDSIKAEIKQDPDLKDANPDRVISAFLKSETGSDGFVGFTKYHAKQGVSIGRVGSSGGNLGEVGTWIYWSIELLAIQIITVLGASSVAKNPYCESSDEWYQDEERIGSVNPEAASNFLELLNSGRFGDAGAAIEALSEMPIEGSLVVSKQVSPKDTYADVFVKIGKIGMDDKGNSQTNDVQSGMMAATEYQVFHRG